MVGLEGCNCPLHPPLALSLVLAWLYPWSLLSLIVLWYVWLRWFGGVREERRKYERKCLGGGEKISGNQVFSHQVHQNSISLNWGENIERWIVAGKWLNYPLLLHASCFFFFAISSWTWYNEDSVSNSILNFVGTSFFFFFWV